MLSKKIVVTGRVQGVGFRYFVKQKALQRELKGWVRNRFSGEVEMIIAGDESAMNQFVTDLMAGNGFSNIETIDIVPLEHNKFHSFDIIETA